MWMNLDLPLRFLISDGDFRRFPLFAHHHLPQDLILSRLPSKHHKLHWLDWNQPTQSQSQCILSKDKNQAIFGRMVSLSQFTVWVEWGRKILGSPGRFCDSPPLAQHPGPRSYISVAFFAWKDRCERIFTKRGWAMEIIQIAFLLLV